MKTISENEDTEMNDSTAKIEIEFLPASVKVGDRIGSTLYEDSSGTREWYDVIYAGNNLLKMEPRETIENK